MVLSRLTSPLSAFLDARKHQRLLLAGIAAFLSVIATLTFWLILPDRFLVNESADYHVYYEPVARNLVAGRGLVTSDGSPAIEYPPGHPLVLAGTFASAKLFRISDVLAIRVLILLCTVASCVSVGVIARRLWGNVGGIAAATFWSAYPLHLWLTKQPNSELPFTAFLAASVAVCGIGLIETSRQLWRWFLGGCLLGAAMLVKSIAILLPGVFAGVILMRARALSFATRALVCGAFGLGVAVVVVPWEVWVKQHAGVVVPLSAGGSAAMKDGFTFGIDKRDYRQGNTVPADVAAFMRAIYVQRTPTSGDVLRAVGRQIQERPKAAIKLVGIKLARAWYGTDSERMEGYILAIQLAYVSILLLATSRAWRMGPEARNISVMLWGLVAYFWGMNLLSLPLARYMTPAIGLLSILVPAFLPSEHKPAPRPSVAG